MPIQSDDIKLLKSAVMADVPEGGGSATGIEVIDGQSNNLFPDTSTDDRAAGRVQMRKVFGAAHTSDTDTLMGASFAVLAPPADPLVHVTLFNTPGWADERTTARETVERYMVKGPRYSCRVMDTHYTGSLLLQLYQVGGSNFPSAGDAIVLRNPNGAEQYVRITKVTLSSGNFNSIESGTVFSFAASVAVCELAQALSMDVMGPPVARVVADASFAQVFTTTVASGAAFYGVKPLAAPAAIGDRSVLAAGGIYTPLVPAATIETPLIDIAPLTTRSSLSRTALGTLTLPAQTLTLQPGTVLRLPTAVQPGSLTITRGATVFSDDGAGLLKQGASAVGVVDYRAKSVTMDGGSPSYGSASTVIAYLPATLTDAPAHSDSFTITTANQGLAFTEAFEPPPAPGSFALSYMAQNRWYDLVDNGNGRLEGSDSSYGAGTINYVTGSVAFTLGAIPDVGSDIIYHWGDAAASEAVPVAGRPDRLSTALTLNRFVIPETVSVAWSRAGVNYSAVCGADGALSGAATGTLKDAMLAWAPAVFPDGDVTVTYSRADQPMTSFLSGGGSGGNYMTPLPSITPGTMSVVVPVVPVASYILPLQITLVDNGAGALVCTTPGAVGNVVGSVNYATGEVNIAAAVTIDAYQTVVKRRWFRSSYERNEFRPAYVASLHNASAVLIAAGSGAAVGVTLTAAPAFSMRLPLLAGMLIRTDSLAFACGDRAYGAQIGSLTTDWALTTGLSTPAGSVASGGTITVSALPPNGVNSVAWVNIAQDVSAANVGQGVFRVQSAPIKVGVLQIQSGALVGSANNSGVISGGGWSGTVDFQRGIVRWRRSSDVLYTDWSVWKGLNPIPAASLTYNAVFLQYVPIDGSLLGLETARLPLDGKVPIYRPGGQVIVHNTLTTALPNPLIKGTAYSLGRERIAAVQVRTVAGVKVPGTLYTVDFSAGTVTFPLGSDLTGLDQPFAVTHRVEDELMVLQADVSGHLSLVAGLTHAYPAGTSYVSSKLRKGDLFARAFLYNEQTTWTSVWSDAVIGGAPTATYNQIDFPIGVTNRGAITERWAVIFLSSTTVRVVGESVGQVLTGVSINTAIEAINPQTGVPYFSIPALGWGGGWAVGNVLRFDTAASGAPAWVVRTTLPGPATLASDSATLAFRADVDA